METVTQSLEARVGNLWRVTLIFVGSVITSVIYIRGELFQAENILSSILLSFGGVIAIITILLITDSIRQNEKGKLHSILFRSSFALSLLTVYAIFFLVKPKISLIDMILLLIQSFIFCAFIQSLKSKIILNQNQIQIFSLTGTRTIHWNTITSFRWLDKGTIAILAGEYPKEVFLPLFTFTQKAEILLYFQKNLNKKT